MKEITLSNGLVCQVDDEDYTWATQFNWHAYKGRGTHYAIRHGQSPRGVATTIRMHREILQATVGMIADHRDRNGLNNQRYNLRICSEHQNGANSGARPGGSSSFKGVAYHKQAGKWEAYIRVSWVRKYLGLFVDERDAARAYDIAAREAFGEFACLNFPGENDGTSCISRPSELRLVSPQDIGRDPGEPVAPDRFRHRIAG